MIKNIIAVFIGGGLGCALRYMTGVICFRHLPWLFPIGTLSVNFFSCFIFGLIFAYFMTRSGLNPAWEIAFTAGFCGGLSTVSTFSFEAFYLIKSGNVYFAFTYIISTIILCLTAVYLGYKVGKIV